MSDDSDKTEEASDTKLRKAREEGNIPRSEDLNGFVGIVFVLIIGVMIYFVYPKRIILETGKCFESIWGFAKDKYDLTPDCMVMANTMLGLTGICFALMIFSGFLSYFIMNKGFVIPKEPFKFNIDALNLFTNFQNLFNAQNVVSLAISVFKEVFFYGVLALLIFKFMPVMVYEVFCYGNCSGHSYIYFILLLIAAYSLISLVLAGIDYPLKIHFWKDKLKMSHKDQKDEHKEIEGSPEIKQAQNEFRHEMMNGVPSGPKNATFFVGNAQGIFGIRYNRDESPAPIIVAIGKTPEQLGRIIRIAQGMRRLIIADDDFTKLLLGKGTMGRPVPLEYLTHVRKSIMELRTWEGRNGVVHVPKK